MDLTTICMLLLGAASGLVAPGIIVHSCGMSRSKNAAAAMLRGVLALSLAALGFWAVGAAIAQGSGSSFFGFHAGLVVDARNLADVFTFQRLIVTLFPPALICA